MFSTEIAVASKLSEAKLPNHYKLAFRYSGIPISSI